MGIDPEQGELSLRRANLLRSSGFGRKTWLLEVLTWIPGVFFKQPTFQHDCLHIWLRLAEQGRSQPQTAEGLCAILDREDSKKCKGFHACLAQFHKFLSHKAIPHANERTSDKTATELG